MSNEVDVDQIEMEEAVDVEDPKLFLVDQTSETSPRKELAKELSHQKIVNLFAQLEVIDSNESNLSNDTEEVVSPNILDISVEETRPTARSVLFKKEEARLYSETSLVAMQKELVKAVAAERQKVELDKQGAEYRKRLTAIPVHHKAKSCWTMGYFIDWAIHVSWLGRFLFAFWVLLPPINYGKDFFVAYLCWKHDHTGFFIGTLVITALSSRLLLMAYSDLESIRPRKFLLYLIPGSVCLDFKLEEWTDVAVWLIWEFVILLLTPFVFFLLLYLALRRALFIFQCISKFDGGHTLAFNVIELLFETIPQLALQLVLYFRFADHTLPLEILEIGIGICALSLIKIPLTLIWNWSLILNNRLIFKRHHNSVVKTVKFHPTRDVLASGSWDSTVLFHAVLRPSQVKAKRVASCRSMQINCLCFTQDGTKMAVGGHGLRIWDDTLRKFVLKLPVRKKGVSKRPRGAEISHITFTKDNKYVLCAEGPVVTVYDIESGEIVKRPYCIEQNANPGPALGSISALALSPNGDILLTASTTDTDIYVWRLEGIDFDPVQVRQNAHSETINCLAFTRDSRYFLSGSSDNTVKIWNIENSEECKFVLQYKCDSPIISLAVGAMVEPFEDDLAEDEVREILSSANLQNESRKSDVPETTSFCGPPVFTHQEYLRIGRAILVTGGINTVTVWDLVTGEELEKWEDIDGNVNSVDVSPYGEFVAIGTSEYNVTLRTLDAIVKRERQSRMELMRNV